MGVSLSFSQDFRITKSMFWGSQSQNDRLPNIFCETLGFTNVIKSP